MNTEQNDRFIELVIELKRIEKDMWQLAREVWDDELNQNDEHHENSRRIGDVAEVIGDAIFKAQYCAGY